MWFHKKNLIESVYLQVYIFKNPKVEDNTEVVASREFWIQKEIVSCPGWLADVQIPFLICFYCFSVFC